MERFVDHLRLIDKNDKNYIGEIVKITEKIAEIFLSDEITKKNKISLEDSLEFTNMVHALAEMPKSEGMSYHKIRIKNALASLSETFIDWSISYQVS